MPKRRLTITPTKMPVMTVARRAVKARRMVYVICTPRPQKYPLGKSRIIYIGTTGVHRLAASMAYKAADVLLERGVRFLELYTVNRGRGWTRGDGLSATCS